MSGRFLLDTNAIIYALNRRLTLPAGDYAFSVITEMELLSFAGLSVEEEKTIRTLLAQFEPIGLTAPIWEVAIELRKKHGCKLPDAIIAASAVVTDRTLITHDKKLLSVPQVQSAALDEIVR